LTELVFLKLGGSLITDKTGVETVRPAVIERIAAEISQGLSTRTDMQLLLGHGSGSFGHVAADKYQTRQGVHSSHEWKGFAEVSDSAARLNQIVRNALRQVGLPAVSFQPSASAVCQDGALTKFEKGGISQALEANLIPIVYGDVAFDAVKGGTIVSTEELFAFLALELTPNRILLAGETSGVIDINGAVIQELSRNNLDKYASALGKSRGTDVTGGMATKVYGMVELVDRIPNLSIHIFSGLDPGLIARYLQGKSLAEGTSIVSA
jgi:isopentenyl phosphate kinase